MTESKFTPTRDDVSSAAQTLLDTGKIKRNSGPARLLALLIPKGREVQEAIATKVIAVELSTDDQEVRNWKHTLVKPLKSVGLEIQKQRTLPNGSVERGYWLDWYLTKQKDQRSGLLETDIEVSAADLKRLLNAICRLKGIYQENRSKKFVEWMNSKSASETKLAYFARQVDAKDFDEFLGQTRTVFLSDARGIAALFGIHPLLLDPLLSRKVTEDPICLDLSAKSKSFFDPKGSLADQFRGEKSTYEIQSEKLASADAAFVKLTLKKGGRSDNHAHPGDELMIVLSGRILVTFEGTGATIELKASEAIHFYAEKLHVVRALSNSVIFIVRFYHLEAQSTRQGIWRELEENLQSSSTGPFYLKPEAVAWIRELLPRPEPKTMVGTIEGAECADQLGLARFLEASSSEDFQTLLEAARTMSLEQIGRKYEIDDFLLRHFLLPAEPWFVVLKPEDWKAEAATEPHRPEYLLPARNLSCSDISLARVEFGKGAATRPNRHPGYEAILVEEGSVEVVFPDSPEKSRRLQVNDLCHFDSKRLHVVRNAGGTMARIFVIRFYRDGVTVSTGASASG